MAQLRCEACGEMHNFAAADVARILDEFQKGNMQIVSRDYPYRWEDLSSTPMVTQIKPKCLMSAPGVTPVPVKKRGRPRKDEQRT